MPDDELRTPPDTTGFLNLLRELIADNQPDMDDWDAGWSACLRSIQREALELGVVL